MNHADPSPGRRLRLAMAEENPIQVAGTINAICALLAERAGFRCLYLSGAGVANASFGLPDLGMTTLEHVAEDARRVTAATELPLLVDIDTGWETTSTIPVTIQTMIAAGVAAVHIEDQLEPKRCGHRPGKRLVTVAEMNDRIKLACDARTDPDFIIMARTDAAADEGVAAAIERSNRYVEAGADMIFAEALVTEENYRQFTSSVPVPVLANITEFGKTPLLTVDQLRELGVRLALYPLTAFRAMNAAADTTYRALREHGTQASVVETMQTRNELYDLLDYHTYEQQIDAAFESGEKSK